MEFSELVLDTGTIVICMGMVAKVGLGYDPHHKLSNVSRFFFFGFFFFFAFLGILTVG